MYFLFLFRKLDFRGDNFLGRIERDMSSNLNELLDKAKNLLKEETTKISYDTWFQSMEIDSMEGNNIVILVTSIFQKEILETKFQELLLNTFNFLTNMECNISIIQKSDKEAKENTENTQ